MKRGSLSESEKDFIKTNSSLTLVELSEKLDRSQKIILSYINQVTLLEQNVEKPVEKTEEVTGVFNSVTFDSLVGKRSRSTILTKAASEFGDEFTKRNNKRENSRCIHAIKKIK